MARDAAPENGHCSGGHFLETPAGKIQSSLAVFTIGNIDVWHASAVWPQAPVVSGV
jgi:hypothetical protein